MANKSNYFPRRSSHFKNYKVILSGRGSQVAENIGLKKDESEKIALEIKKIVENDLKEYL